MANRVPNFAAVSGQRRRTLKEWWAKFLHAWYSMQLTHYGGKYSVERALALEEYTRNAPITRVVLVVTAPLIVTTAIVLGQESIPLQDPTEGWKMNCGFWSRVGLTGVVAAYTMADQVGPWLDVPGLSPTRTILYCTGVGAGFIAAGVVIAEIWVFPVPFFMPTLSAVITFITFGLFRVMVGTQAFQQMLTRKEEIRRLSRMGSLYGSIIMIYPLYQVLFMKAKHTNYELPVMLLLPLFKFILKSSFASAASHKEDMAPGQVVLSVDFFDALYWASFVQSLSLSTLVIIMIADLGDISIEFRELHRRVQNILKRIHERTCTAITDHNNADLLNGVRSLCFYPEELKNSKIQIRSSLRHSLSPEYNTLLDQLERQIRNGPPSRITTRTSGPALGWVQRGMGSIQPLTPITIMPKDQNSGTDKDVLERIQHRKSRDKSSRDLQEALEILFTSECVVLAEYVQTIVPIIYGAFIMVMVYLPSAKYHTEMVGINRGTVGRVVSRIFLYALLEFVSFVALAVTLRRSCGIHALYQLAFVLETQMSFVLSKLLLWMLVTLTYRVTHFGADCSFRFKWIGK